MKRSHIAVKRGGREESREIFCKNKKKSPKKLNRSKRQGRCPDRKMSFQSLFSAGCRKMETSCFISSCLMVAMQKSLVYLCDIIPNEPTLPRSRRLTTYDELFFTCRRETSGISQFKDCLIHLTAKRAWSPERLTTPASSLPLFLQEVYSHSMVAGGFEEMS